MARCILLASCVLLSAGCFPSDNFGTLPVYLLVVDAGDPTTLAPAQLIVFDANRFTQPPPPDITLIPTVALSPTPGVHPGAVARTGPVASTQRLFLLSQDAGTAVVQALNLSTFDPASPVATYVTSSAELADADRLVVSTSGRLVAVNGGQDQTTQPLAIAVSLLDAETLALKAVIQGNPLNGLGSFTSGLRPLDLVTLRARDQELLAVLINPTSDAATASRVILLFDLEAAVEAAEAAGSPVLPPTFEPVGQLTGDQLNGLERLKAQSDESRFLGIGPSQGDDPSVSQLVFINAANPEMPEVFGSSGVIDPLGGVRPDAGMAFGALVEGTTRLEDIAFFTAGSGVAAVNLNTRGRIDLDLAFAAGFQTAALDISPDLFLFATGFPASQLGRLDLVNPGQVGRLRPVSAGAMGPITVTNPLAIFASAF
ncbi:MAG: hypothetical protein HY335_05070 [Deinococcus sp.]|nr:hypothetical protein [Deinococcus sp.]